MATALVVGNMVGSGVFLLPASLGVYGGISLVGWLITSCGSLLCALVFARLSRAFPRAGGPYVYSREGFGEFTGFVVAWGYWVSIWTTNAALAVAFVSYLTVFWGALGENAALAATMSVGTIWLLTAVNAAGVRQAGAVQLVTTVLKLTPLVAVAVLGLAWVRVEHFVPFNVSGDSAGSAVTACVALTLWAFLGLESATIPAEHVSRPEVTIPRATILGTSLAAAVYVLGTVAVMGILPPPRLAASTAPFADAAGAIWGGWAGYAVGAGAAVSCFGALNGWILLQGQIPLAVARDGLFPALFGRLSARGTPVAGLVLSSLLATALVAMNYTRGLVEQFTFIILLATLTALVPYVFCTLSALVLMRRAERAGRVAPGVAPVAIGNPGSRVRGRGRASRLTVVVTLLAFAYSLWAVAGAGTEIIFWGFLLLLAGMPVYAGMRVRGRAGAGSAPRRPPYRIDPY